MSARNTLLFGAALAASTAAIAYDHVTKPVPPRPVYGSTGVAAGGSPCAAGAPASPCAAGAPAAPGKAAPPPPPAQRPAAEPAKSAPPPPPSVRPAGEEAPDLVVEAS